MIEVVTLRRMTFEGKTYAKGDTVKMPAQQFNDLEPTGLVERAPAEKAASKTKTTKAQKPLMTIPDYVDGYLAKRWGEEPPVEVVEFAANNSTEIEQEFQLRAKAAD